MAGEVIGAFVRSRYVPFADLAADPGRRWTPWDPPPPEGMALLREHLGAVHGAEVTAIEPLGGAFRVERAGAEPLVARVFGAARPRAQVEGDAAVLRLVAAHGIESEQPAGEQPVTEVAGHTVLVTTLVPGRAQPLPAAEHGHLYGLLHTVPLDTPAARRPGGGWHGLGAAGGGRAADLAELDPLLADARALTGPAGAEHLDALRRALDRLDLCEGLPTCLVHVDFGGPNILTRPDGVRVAIDWTGAGEGARVESLASTLAGFRTPTDLRAFVAAYREHVALEPEELDRIGGTLLTHWLVLACWQAVFVPGQAGRLAAALAVVEPTLAGLVPSIRRAFTA